MTAKLVDGRSERGDFLLGADGLHSNVRRSILGEAESRRHATPATRSGRESSRKRAWSSLRSGTSQLVYGPGLRFCYYRVDDDRLYWFAVANAEEGGQDGPGLKDKLHGMFKGWMDPVDAMIDATDEQVIHRRDLYDRDPITRWGEGRVTLIGDAARSDDLRHRAGRGPRDRGRRRPQALLVRNRRHRRRASLLREAAAAADRTYAEDLPGGRQIRQGGRTPSP